VQSEPFSLLAEVYDAIMSDVEYEAWADFILDLALDAGCNARTLLDLGCGTGNSSAPFLEKGLRVTGIDRASAMLEIARTKLPGATFVQADFTDFVLPETFDLAVSIFDSLNNLLDPEDFYRTATRVHAHLRPGGLFIFDVNTTVGLRNLWEDDRAEGWVDNVYYLWQHSFDERTKRAKVVAYCEKGTKSFTEVHYERPYDPAEVRALLKRSGFAEVQVLTYPSGYPATAETERIWVVARR
jgi:ubiquinone/menaquinone biosynthesis C-methylase UbiE